MSDTHEEETISKETLSLDESSLEKDDFLTEFAAEGIPSASSFSLQFMKQHYSQPEVTIKGRQGRHCLLTKK